MTILSTHDVQYTVHDTSHNRTWVIIVCQLNVALSLSSKMEVSLDEAQTEEILAPDDDTL